jgi:hypothetical protein
VDQNPRIRRHVELNRKEDAVEAAIRLGEFADRQFELDQKAFDCN